MRKIKNGQASNFSQFSQLVFKNRQPCDFCDFSQIYQKSQFLSLRANLDIIGPSYTSSPKCQKYWWQLEGWGN